MRRNFWKHYRRETIGGCFFLALFSMGYYTIVFAHGISLDRPVYVPVQLETAEGLLAGAKVEIQGVERGFISSLHYMNVDRSGWPLPRSSTEEPYGQTVIAILQLRSLPITYADYVAYSRAPSPLAPRGIDFMPGVPDGKTPIRPETLTEEEHLEFLATGRLARHAEQSLIAIKNFDDPLYLAAKLLAENKTSISRIIRNITHITDSINQGDGTVGLLLNEGQLHDSSMATLIEVNHLVGEMRELLESLRENLGAIDSATALLSYVLIFL